MSQWHDHIARISINMQGVAPAVGFPGWTSPVLQAALGMGSGKVADAMRSLSQPPSKWLRDISCGSKVLAREYRHERSRYPYQTNCNYRYVVQFKMGGLYTRVGWAIGATTVERANRGKGSNAILKIERVRLYYTDGTVSDEYVSLVLASTINVGNRGTNGTFRWSGVCGNGKPIANAVLFLYYFGGSGCYHDAGDRSPNIYYPPYNLNAPLSNVMQLHNDRLSVCGGYGGDNAWGVRDWYTFNYYREYFYTGSSPAVIAPKATWYSGVNSDAYVGNWWNGNHVAIDRW